MTDSNSCRRRRRTHSDYFRLEAQGAKLVFLIDKRRDQRLPDPKKQSSTVGGGRIVNNQKSLAAELLVKPDLVNKWFAETLSIHIKHIEMISKIFRVEVDHLINWSWERFRKKYASERSGWTDLLAGAAPCCGTVVLKDPRTVSRHPTLDAPLSPPGKVPAGRPFWCVFDAPQSCDQLPLWAGWYAFFFSLDTHTDDVMAFYPLIHNRSGIEKLIFPNAGPLIFPWNDSFKMRAGVEDIGKDCILICLLVRPDAPPDLLEAARQLPPADITNLVSKAVEREQAGVTIARYHVIE